jgi:uncharacterized protein YndB with AHSA1/START domain
MADERPGTGRVDRTLTIRASVDELWPAISTPDGLEAWLGGEVEIDPRPGRPVLVRWPDRSTSRGAVERVEPNRRFVFRWRRIAGIGLTLSTGEPTRVEITLTPLGPRRTRVDIVESPAPLPAPPVAVPRPSPRSAGRGAA